MYNELNKINNSIKNQNDYIKKDAEYKSYLKDLQIQFKDLLQFELMEAMHNNINIYDLDFKKSIIFQVVEDYKAQKQNNNIFAKYENEVRLYLLQNYYAIANQSRMYIKRQADNTQAIQDDYKKQIAIDKWNLQRERERVKLAIERKKLQQLQQKQIQKQYKPVQARQPQRYYTPIRSGSGGEIAKVLIILMFAPIAIFGLIIYGFISAAAKTK